MENKSSKKIEKHLYIFNLSTDDNDNVLAFTQDWVIAFKEIVSEVSVFSTWVGKNSLPPDVQVTQIGGGNLLLRGKAIFRLTKIGLKVIKNRHNAIVFHHMSTRTSTIMGPVFRCFKVNQGLWYSHSRVTRELLFSEKFMNKLFSSTPGSLPIKSNKARFTGHGINVDKFPDIPSANRKFAILSLGRIAKIKRNEILIDAVAESNRAIKEIHLVGPLGADPAYLQELKLYGSNRGVAVEYLGEVSHSNVAQLFLNYSICFTGSPNSVDKSVIEGALCGCFTLASQSFILSQTTMNDILEQSGNYFNKSLAVQISILDTLYDRDDLRKMLRNGAAEKNSVQRTTAAIIRELTTP